MGPRVAVLAIFLTITAGCLGQGGSLVPGATKAGASGSPSLGGVTLAFDATHGVLSSLPAAFAGSASPLVASFDLGVSGAEPNLGVTSKGAIYYSAFEKIMQSKDGGASWKQVSTLLSSPQTLDPNLFVDPSTDRVYSDQLYIGCSYLSWSDDEGASWTTNPVACGLPDDDHQSVTTGAFAAPRQPTVYKDVVYYCTNKAEGAACAASLTGGLTWGPAITVFPDPDPLGLSGGESITCLGIHGKVATGPDGTVYLPKDHCDNAMVGVSHDNGLTWTTSLVGKNAAKVWQDPAVTTDAKGGAYYLYEGADGLQYYSHSTDEGKTWSAPTLATPPGVHNTRFSAITAGDPGRVTIAYLGTWNTTDGWKGTLSDNATAGTRYHLFLATTLDGQDPSPTWVTTQVTPDDAPVQMGSICHCGGGPPDRNLLDFIDLQHDKDGRAYAAYASGCLTCTTNDTSRASEASIAVQEAGPSLYEAKGTLAPLAGLERATNQPQANDRTIAAGWNRTSPTTFQKKLQGHIMGGAQGRDAFILGSNVGDTSTWTLAFPAGTTSLHAVLAYDTTSATDVTLSAQSPGYTGCSTSVPMVSDPCTPHGTLVKSTATKPGEATLDIHDAALLAEGGAWSLAAHPGNAAIMTDVTITLTATTSSA